MSFVYEDMNKKYIMKWTRKFSLIIGLVCMVGVSGFGVSCWAEENVIKIGCALPLSGGTAPSGAHYSSSSPKVFSGGDRS